MGELLGEEFGKIHPKLRMFADGSTDVNSVRAELCSSVAVASSIHDESRPILRGEEPRSATRAEFPTKPATPPLEELPRGVLVDVFVETLSEASPLPRFARGAARRGSLLALTVPIDRLPELAADPSVTRVELGEPIAAPTPDVGDPCGVAAPDATMRRFGSVREHRDGEGILIGIIDVQGFDFSHADFLDDGRTRFVRIWDQGGDRRPTPRAANPERFSSAFDFGAEFRKEHLDEAIEAASDLGLPATEIEEQSTRIPGSHGTHVASIAAGNRGVCRRAMIAGVTIALPTEESDRRTSLYDSTRLALAVEYLLGVADELSEELGRKVPISINISLGTNGHAHDGSTSLSRWIDSVLAVPGRCVTVAAGNAGQERATSPSDVGFVMGRIHTSGRVPGRFHQVDLEWSVVGNGIVDVSENEFELWYSEQDRFAISLRPPGVDASGRRHDWIGPIEPREFLQNHQLPDGSLVSIYNELYHPANGSNYAAIYLSPFFGREAIIGTASGEWTVRIHGRDVRDGRFHAWLERDDPRRVGRVGAREAWRFPSFFGESTHVDECSVGSLACGRRVIAVANLHESDRRVHITSSQGPTRDGRAKPDIAAPGTDIVAANGFSMSDSEWIAMTGTSMAAPFVAGVIGLMLAIEPRLTAAQIEGILHRTSQPLPGAPYQWTNDAGFGRIDPEAAFAEARTVNDRTERRIS